MHTQEEIEDSKIELNASLQKLYKNKDFKKVVLDGYLEHGSVFLTKNLMKVKPEYKADVVAEMDARSILWKYLDSIEEEVNSILESRSME